MENIISTGFGIALGLIFVIIVGLTLALEHVWGEHGSTHKMVIKLRAVYYGVSVILTSIMVISALIYYL